MGFLLCVDCIVEYSCIHIYWDSKHKHPSPRHILYVEVNEL